MKGISLWQPWATLVALKLKTIETRDHDRFRSLVGQRIAIHAARKWNEDGLLLFRMKENHHLIYGYALPVNVPNILMSAERCRGRIVCTAMVVDGQWERDCGIPRVDTDRRALCDVREKYLLFLEDIQPLKERVPFKGRRGIFNVPDQLVGAVADPTGR